MANKPQQNNSEKSHFTYVKFAEMFDPPLLPNIKLTSERKTRKRDIPKPRTLNAINRLCQIRLEAIKNRVSIPTIIGASQEAGIDFKTIQKYMPELLDKWNDRNYKPEALELLE